MTIEDAIRAKLLTMSAVTALTTTIRPDELAQKDLQGSTCAIIISVNEEIFDNDLDGTCSLVAARVAVVAVSRSRTQARALSEAIRINGVTPGTGLAGCTVTTDDLHFQAMLERRSVGFVPDEEGKETGVFVVDSSYYVTYPETT